MPRVESARAPASIFADRHVLIVAAHPDDETLFCGAQFALCSSIAFIHTTDGAHGGRAARRHGFPNRTAYAAARRLEFRAALSVGAVSADYCGLGFRDGTLSFHMVEATLLLARKIDGSRPGLVLTHAYEGGHRDHDATALIVRHAMRRTAKPVPIWEFAGYHRRDGALRFASFASDELQTHTYRLSEGEQRRKRSMLQRFHSQREVVAMFPFDRECLRPAPVHNFTRPPVGPDLASGGFGIPSPTEVWCRIAARAVADLELDPPVVRSTSAMRLAFKAARRIWKLRGSPYGRYVPD